MRALERLVEHEVLGQRARFERYMADLLYVLAAGINIDTDKAERFGTLLDKVYMNPFVAPIKPMGKEDIKKHIIGKIDELLSGGKLNGSYDAGRQDHAG